MLGMVEFTQGWLLRLIKTQTPVITRREKFKRKARWK